jgi:hypothetical protein
MALVPASESVGYTPMRASSDVGRSSSYQPPILASPAAAAPAAAPSVFLFKSGKRSATEQELGERVSSHKASYVGVGGFDETPDFAMHHHGGMYQGGLQQSDFEKMSQVEVQMTTLHDDNSLVNDV